MVLLVLLQTFRIKSRAARLKVKLATDDSLDGKLDLLEIVGDGNVLHLEDVVRHVPSRVGDLDLLADVILLLLGELGAALHFDEEQDLLVVIPAWTALADTDGTVDVIELIDDSIHVSTSEADACTDE